MLEIAFRKCGSVAILDLSGNIDIDTSNFIEKIGWCLENGYEDILCNFENVNLIDYAGLSVVAIAFKNVANHKGRVKLLSVPGHIKTVFSLMYLDRVAEMYDSEHQAVCSFKEDKAIAEIQKKQLRRRFKRLSLDIKVEFKPKAKDVAFTSGKVMNISGVGVLVLADVIYPLNEILKVRLSLLPRPGTLELEAKVAWLVQKELQPELYPAMGLEFYNLDSGTQKKIADFVDRNLPSQSLT